MPKKNGKVKCNLCNSTVTIKYLLVHKHTQKCQRLSYFRKSYNKKRVKFKLITGD